ncbi:c2 domain containing protein [Niveomyces insectorum RCEF 264]|uniref:C2 domain containing protein n=1 Tax=Niveomyces insectorum RCEF 264 TaxID=1081102 RepID=A0A167NU35_9HYPO|nr:c2 domain containing protein [Niveomyces insectorum RCEF 264]
MANIQQKVVPSGQHYSGSNPIPSIKQLIDSLDRDKKKRDAEIDAQQSTKKGAGKSTGISDHVPRDPAKAGKHRRTVTDPVTGKDVEIDDMDASMLRGAHNPTLSVPNANLNKPTTVKTEATQSGEEYRHKQDITAPPDPLEPGSTSDVPIHGEKTNVLFHPTPSVSFEPMYATLEARANALCATIVVAIVVVGKLFGGRLLGLVPLAVCVASGVFLWVKEVIRQGRATEWSSEQARGETAVVNLIPESVEWLNAALALGWGLVNSDMFAGVADTLEDVMQASLPAVVENVKVTDISQGSNPLRVLSLRALPDSHVEDLATALRDHDGRTKDPQEAAADAEGGDFYNLEATVAYHALPSGNDVSSKARNMGMHLIFYLGVRGLFGVPFPVWVELNGLVCTVRLRVALSPSPPFAKTLSFTLMGLPKVDAGCIPLIQRGANVLNLPLISNFVNWAIAAAASMYVAPKSMTLDVGKMLQGDSIQKDTEALGVLYVCIDKATDLSKQDRRGSAGGGSDPYICVAFSKFGKPQYCTRVIEDDLNPVFAERAALLVTADIVKADEQLSLELWDSDRSSADDLVGKVELSIQELIQHPGQLFPQVSRLRGMHAESTMPGQLHWRVGFFGKTQFRRALRTDGKDPFMPQALQDNAALQTDHGVITNAEEDAVVHTPPDPLWPSGILSIVVHQIVGLELENAKGSYGARAGGREYEPARPEAGELKEEQGNTLPSAYCTIIVNDELVYKTRSKVASSRPIFEAGTERFVRDWRSTIATVTVRDRRNRQHDPILGVVPLKLSDILLNSSQSTRWYPLDGGVGFGRVRISLLFRSVELQLPPAQVGFGEVGTFEFLSDTLATARYAPSSHVKVRLRTGGSSATLKSETCARTDDGAGLVWDLRHGGKKAAAHGNNDDDDVSNNNNNNNNNSVRVRLPVQYRYRSPVFFEFHPAGLGKKDRAYAALWLQDLVDNEARDFDLPVWSCDRPLRLSQNYITEANCETVPDLALAEVGRLRFRGRFKPGADRDHHRFVSDNDSRETIETWEACFAEGVRGEGVEAQVPALVQKLHDDSLLQGRDVLARAPPEDKQKWLAKDGTDWTGAFGPDPLAGAEVDDGDDNNGAGQDKYQYQNDSSDDDDDDDDGDEEDDNNYGKDSGYSNGDGNGESSGRRFSLSNNAAPNSGSGSGSVDDGVPRSDGAAPGASSSAAGAEPRRTSGSQGRPPSKSVSGTSGTTGSSDSAGGASGSNNPIKQYKDYKSKSRDLHRRQRGLMQWKPMRNLQFAKDEATFAVRKLVNSEKLTGRTPDVETEV